MYDKMTRSGDENKADVLATTIRIPG